MNHIFDFEDEDQEMEFAEKLKKAKKTICDLADMMEDVMQEDYNERGGRYRDGGMNMRRKARYRKDEGNDRYDY